MGEGGGGIQIKVFKEKYSSCLSSELSTLHTSRGSTRMLAHSNIIIRSLEETRV